MKWSGKLHDRQCIPRSMLVLPRRLLRVCRGYIMATDTPRIPTRTFTRFSYTTIGVEHFYEISRSFGYSLDTLRARHRGDVRGIATLDSLNNGKIVTIQWAHYGSCYIRGYGLPLLLSDNAVYLFGAHSLPEARITGVFNCAMNQLVEKLKSENKLRFYGLIDASNQASYTYHRNLNFEPIERVSCLRLLSGTILCRTILKTRRCRITLSTQSPRGLSII